MLSAVLRSETAIQISIKIINTKEIYHIGASLKDLGKKWFAFSKFELDAIKMLNRLEAGK